MQQPYPFLLTLLCAIMLSCTQKQPTNETQATATASPPVQSAASIKKTESPEDLIRALYQAHKSGKSPFFQAKDRTLIDRFFVNEMADLIWQDAVIVEKSGELAFMEADPLYNAQDTDIADFVIHPAEIDNDGAEVLVTFTNFGEKQEFTFLLDKENGQWRIGDIFYGDGSQLFQMLSGRAEEQN
jgi:hypothetical protein